MPGFFSRQSLTEYSSHLLDWSRVASLLSSGTHRYSRKELIQRGFVVGSMLVGSGLAYSQCEEDDSLGIKGLYSMSGCFVGFVLSHVVVIWPLVKKRLEMRHDCLEAKEKILSYVSLLTDCPEQTELKDQIEAFIDNAMQLSLSTEKNAKASQSWGYRRRILLNLLELFEKQAMSFEELNDFWEENDGEMLEKLSNPLPVKTVNSP